jgi:hypothetical protein
MLPRRVLRHLGLDRNPLRRRVDRVERWLAIALVATILVVSPVVAWLVGSAVYRGGLHAAGGAYGDRFPTTAVLEEDTVALTPVDATVPVTPLPARARWTGPDGVAHTGRILPDQQGRAGAVVVVWTDAAGNLVPRPPDAEQATGNGFVVGIAVLLASGVAAAAVWLVARRALERRRLDYWQTQWMSVEPRWSGRR